MTESLAVVWVGTDQVKPYFRNPRKRSAESINKIAASITEFGWQQPIVVDPDNVIIIGHGRHLAAQQMKAKRVPIVVANLPEGKARALRLADNRTNRESDWDLGELMKEIGDLRELQIPMDATGFSEDDLKRLSDDLAESNLEEVAASEPVDTEEAGDARPPAEADDMVPLNELMTVEQRTTVHMAMKHAQQRHDYSRRGEALWHICDTYLNSEGRT